MKENNIIDAWRLQVICKISFRYVFLYLGTCRLARQAARDENDVAYMSSRGWHHGQQKEQLNRQIVSRIFLAFSMIKISSRSFSQNRQLSLEIPTNTN